MCFACLSHQKHVWIRSLNRDLTDKPYRNRIKSGRESKGDISISVRVIENMCPSLLHACVRLSSTNLYFFQ